jgi:hypothetical protein
MKRAVVLSVLSLVAVPAVRADESSPQLESLNERVTELEAAQALNRVHLSGVFINRFEDFRTTYGVPGQAQDKDRLDVFSTFLALNLDFDVTERLKLYTTLGMSKFWQNDGRNEYAGNWQASEGGSFGYAGSTLQVDRAYMAYAFSFPLTLAVGRMPTNNGVPINQLDGLVREGTYPRFAYNAIFDGIAAIFDFSRYLPLGISFKLRAFYTPNINIDKSNRTRQLTDGTVKVDSNTPQYAILAEFFTTRLSPVVETLSLYYMFYQYINFYNDGANTPATPGAAPNNPLDSATAHMLYLGLEGIGHIGLNASLSALFYHDTTTLLDGSGATTTLSKAYLLNVNQRLDFILTGTVFGFELIKTDPSFYLDEWTYLNVIPFYSSPASQGVHVFASVPLGGKVRVRVGWYRLHSDPYNDLVFSSTVESDSNSFYVQLRLGF